MMTINVFCEPQTINWKLHVLYVASLYVFRFNHLSNDVTALCLWSGKVKVQKALHDVDWATCTVCINGWVRVSKHLLGHLCVCESVQTDIWIGSYFWETATCLAQRTFFSFVEALATARQTPYQKNLQPIKIKLMIICYTDTFCQVLHLAFESILLIWQGKAWFISLIEPQSCFQTLNKMTGGSCFRKLHLNYL